MQILRAPAAALAAATLRRSTDGLSPGEEWLPGPGSDHTECSFIDGAIRLLQRLDRLQVDQIVNICLGPGGADMRKDLTYELASKWERPIIE